MKWGVKGDGVTSRSGESGVQCRTTKLDNFCSGSHSSFLKNLTLPSCSEWQNTSKTALWGFSHDFLGMANFFGPKNRPDLDSEGLEGALAMSW